MLDLGSAGRALMVRRRWPLLGEVACLLRGPVRATGNPDLRAEALGRLAARGVRLVETEAPCPSLRRASFRAVATPAHVAELDLTCTHQARRAALAGTWRNALRWAEGAGL